MRRPRLGDVVLVRWPRATAAEAAIVTAVHSDVRVSLTVLPPGAAPFARTSVPHASEALDTFSWDFAPER